MIRFYRVTSADEPAFAKAWALYTASFPAHEQRTKDRQAKLLENPLYHFDVLYGEQTFAGILLYWTLTGYTYVEHFAIDSNRRGNALGSKSLAAFCGRHPLVVLEIDPPLDEIAIRRQGFYQRLGFLAGTFTHMHPAYRAEYPPHKLVVMSYPRALAGAEVELFQRELRETVMADAIPTEK